MTKIKAGTGSKVSDRDNDGVDRIIKDSSNHMDEKEHSIFFFTSFQVCNSCVYVELHTVVAVKSSCLWK